MLIETPVLRFALLPYYRQGVKWFTLNIYMKPLYCNEIIMYCNSCNWEIQKQYGKNWWVTNLIEMGNGRCTVFVHTYFFLFLKSFLLCTDL